MCTLNVEVILAHGPLFVKYCTRKSYWCGIKGKHSLFFSFNWNLYWGSKCYLPKGRHQQVFLLHKPLDSSKKLDLTEKKNEYYCQRTILPTVKGNNFVLLYYSAYVEQPEVVQKSNSHIKQATDGIRWRWKRKTH